MKTESQENMLVLLPGLDGTGELFNAFLDAVPRRIETKIISYARDYVVKYDGLLESIEKQLEGPVPMILVAESFSGPLAVRYAAKHPARVQSLILCASFIEPPRPRWLRHLIFPALFRLPLFTFVVRSLLVGRDAPDAIVKEVQRVIRLVGARVISHRLVEMLSVDVAEALRNCDTPLLYLRATQDALIDADCLEKIRTLRPDVHVAEVAGPHLLLQAAPQAAWIEIELFLKRV